MNKQILSKHRFQWRPMDTRKVNNSEILNYYILKQIRNPLNLNTNILKILIVLHSLV